MISQKVNHKGHYCNLIDLFFNTLIYEFVISKNENGHVQENLTSLYKIKRERERERENSPLLSATFAFLITHLDKPIKKKLLMLGVPSRIFFT